MDSSSGAFRSEDMTVQDMYRQLLAQGKPPKDAAKIAQEKTGMSVVTGRPINKDLPYKVKYTGQYGGKNG